MARAKRTARAEARRRYRSQIASGEAQDDERVPPRPPERDEPAPRPSIRTAFKAAFRPLNLQEDLRLLPWLTLRTKAVWVPTALSALSAIALVTFGVNVWTVLLFQYFAYVLPVGALFLAGFLAPRASWLAGFVVGLAATGILAITLQVGALGEEVAPDVSPAIVGQGLITSTFGGAFIAAAAAWYKRFLHLANPNRGRRPQQRQRQNQRRR